MVQQKSNMTEEKDAMHDLEDYTTNARHHQLETLRSILRHNGSVHYLQAQGWDPTTLLEDPATFKRVVPLSSYEDYAHYINQMADGKHRDPFLSVDHLLCFFYSSGATSMKPKLIPCFDSRSHIDSLILAYRCTVAVLQRLFPPRTAVNKILSFLYADNTITTKCGLQVMAASSYSFLSGAATPQQLAIYSSPPDVFIESHVEHQMYCHLLCGLRSLDVIDAITAPYAIGLIKALGLLRSKWEQLCDDIECGFPSHEISGLAMREAVTRTLGGPQPELSNRIRLICESNNWGGIVCRLWPNVRYIKCVSTGSMKQYYPKLKYYAGEVPVLGGDYWSSECCVGINLDIMQPPETTRYVIVPTAAYFEFHPFSMNERNDVAEEIVDLSSVEVGKMYEVVVTTHGGLYRYRLGDIVRVVGFYNSSPQVVYVMRAPKSTAEILSEKDLISAVEDFQLALRGAMRIEIVEFASFLDQESWPKQLKVFLEVREDSDFLEHKLGESVLTFKRYISSLENGLGALYKAQRDRGHVGNLSILILRPGAFDQLSALAFKIGTPASHYKPPKIIRNHDIVKLIEKLAVVTVSLDGE